MGTFTTSKAEKASVVENLLMKVILLKVSPWSILDSPFRAALCAVSLLYRRDNHLWSFSILEISLLEPFSNEIAEAKAFPFKSKPATPVGAVTGLSCNSLLYRMTLIRIFLLPHTPSPYTIFESSRRDSAWKWAGQLLILVHCRVDWQDFPKRQPGSIEGAVLTVALQQISNSTKRLV